MLWILFAVYLAGAVATSTYLLGTIMILIYKLEQKQIRSVEVLSWTFILRVIFWPVIFVTSVVQHLLKGV